MKSPGVDVYAALVVLAEVHKLFWVVLLLKDVFPEIFLLLLSLVIWHDDKPINWFILLKKIIYFDRLL